MVGRSVASVDRSAGWLALAQGVRLFEQQNIGTHYATLARWGPFTCRKGGGLINSLQKLLLTRKNDLIEIGAKLKSANKSDEKSCGDRRPLVVGVFKTKNNFWKNQGKNKKSTIHFGDFFFFKESHPQVSSLISRFFFRHKKGAYTLYRT